MKDRFHAQIIKSMLANLKNKNNNMIFIKYYNAFDIPIKEMQSMISQSSKARLLYHKYDSSKMQDAYEPFLDWIKDLYMEFLADSMTIDEFLIECKVYFVQRIIFKSYFLNGKCYRDEEPMANEIKFEEIKFIESLINMFVYISNEIPLIFVLDKLHLSCSSSVRFITSLVQRDDTENIALEVSFNEVYNIHSYMKYEWSELIKVIQNKNLTYDMETFGEDKVQEHKKSFVFEIEKLNEYIGKIVNMVYSLAFNQALNYLTIIHEKIVFEKMNVNFDNKFKIYALLALTDINTNNPEHAFLMCESIHNLLKKSDNLLYQYISNYLQIMIQFYLKQKGNAEKCVNECMRIANLMKDEKLVLKTKLIYHRSLGIWCDVLFNFSYYEEPDDVFIDELMEQGYINSVIYMCGLCKEQTPEDIKLIDEGKKPLTYFKKALKMAGEIGNDDVIRQLYNRKHVFAHSINCYNFLEQITHERNKYIVADDNDIMYIQANAYMSSQKEDYMQAHEYNNNALKIIYKSMINERYEQSLSYKTKKMDVMLIAGYLKKNNIQYLEDTLHNIAVNCISTGDYQMACKYLMIMVNIMESENRIRFTNGNISKIYGMIALCNYYLDVLYKCYLYEEKAERQLSHLIFHTEEKVSYAFWDDCMYFYRFVKGLLLKTEYNFTAAKEEFELAQKHMEPLYSCYFFLYPTFAIEKADLLIRLGEKDEAIKVLESCLDYCEKEKLTDKANMIKAKLEEKEYVYKKYDFSLKDVSIDELIDATRYQSYEVQVNENLNDTTFITSWQDILNNITDTEMLLNTAMEALQKIYVLDGSLFIKVSKNIPKVLYNNTKINLKDEDMNNILLIFENNRSSFITNRTDKSFSSYKLITSIFGVNKIVTLIGVPVIRDSEIDSIFITYVEMKENFRTHFSIMKEERLDIIHLAINQLVDAKRRLETKQELESSLRREAHANEAKSTFLANMSHEIRTPMNTVMGMCEIVLREELTDSVRYNVEGIMSASKNLLSIINDILDFSKIESGKMSIVEVDYSLSEVLEDVQNMIKQRIGNKQVELKIDVDKNIPDKLHGDEVRIRQILINLLNNAVKFTDNGHIILKFRMTQTDNKILLFVSISDTGRGIKKDDVEKLFQSFQRVDMQKNRTIEGTGLGLSICKTLLELMGGRITVQSEYGKGSTFSFELPQAVVDDTITYEKACKQKKKNIHRFNYITGNISMPDANVLIVDDNEMNLRVAQGLMQPYEMKIDMVKSGKECIEYVRKNKYDLIMLDHMMPEMDGIETLSNLKQIKDFDVPVIALTANAISGVKEMYMDKGFSDYLSKPIDCVKLEDILIKFLNSKVVVSEKVKKENEELINYTFDNIDTDIGLHYSGNNIVGYVEVLKVYLRTGNEIMNRLSESINNLDWKKYRIDIHALKSSSLAIGAEELFDKCRKLEDAVKITDVSYIRQNHNMAMEVFKNVLDEINRFINYYENKKDNIIIVLNDDELINMLEELLEYVEQFIMVKAEQLVDKIMKCKYEKSSICEILESIKEDICSYDTEQAEEKIKELIDNIKH